MKSPTNARVNAHPDVRTGLTKAGRKLTPLVKRAKREIIVLIMIAGATCAGYGYVVWSASKALNGLTNSCTIGFESQIKGLYDPSPPTALLTEMCRCLASALYAHNSVWRLALVQHGLLRIEQLDPVTERDEVRCVEDFWLPDIDLAEHRSF